MARTEAARGPRTAAASGARLRAGTRGQRVSLCEVLDRVLNKGVVISGDIIISIANVDLLYLGLNAVITSVETMQQWSSSESPKVVARGG